VIGQDFLVEEIRQIEFLQQFQLQQRLHDGFELDFVEAQTREVQIEEIFAAIKESIGAPCRKGRI
jgi:hypothetical protein